MSFNAFQTATATFKKITTDGAGDETVSSSITVKIDPVFGWKRTFTTDNEAVEGQETVISEHESDLQGFFDETHYNYELEYNGKEYDVKHPTPFYKIGTTQLDFIQVIL